MISNSRQQTIDSSLDKLVEQICDQMQSGKQVELDDLIQQYPDMADRLRVIYPTVLAMAHWSYSDCDTSAQMLDLEGFGNREIGDFKIIRQIGRGGMGVVYEAQQLSIDRRVALKVLPLAALIDSRALQRFKNEVTAIATLEHPHIVSVYAVGEERGIHFYAMQLVRGQSLAAVIRELRLRANENSSISGAIIGQVVSDMEQESTPNIGESKPPVSSVSDDDVDTTAETRARDRSVTARSTGDATYFRNVASLVIQAADALQHAHDNGIVHRDVKPGNLLLDNHGCLHVTDFGLARIETGAGVTMTGDVLGTLRYMSPEQVLANRVVIDHRTDVYSLGATLYELLTLQPIWPGYDKAELIRRISFEEPVRPNKINPGIPADLETIILKAISKNPNDRYESAQTLADDLMSFLEHKPIVARRPTVVQRIGKWTRRNPAIMWSAVAVSIIVSIGSAIAAGLILSANDKTQSALADSEQSLEKVLDAVDDFLWRMGETHLLDVPGSGQLRIALLEDAREICESLIDSKSNSPRVQLRSASALASMGIIKSQLGNDQGAERDLKASIDKMELWISKHPDHELNQVAQQDLIGSHMELAGIYLDEGQIQRAIVMYRTATQSDQRLRRREDYGEHPRALLVSGMLHRKFSGTLRTLNQFSEAESAGRTAIETMNELVDRYPQDADYRIELARAHRELGASFHDRQNRADAAVHYEQAISILRQWGKKSTDLIWATLDLGQALRDLAVLIGTDPNSDQKEQADKLLNEAVTLFEKLADDYPGIPVCRSSFTESLLQLAGLRREQGEHQSSIDLLQQASTIQRSLVDEFPNRPDYRVELSKILSDYSGMLDMTGQSKASKKVRLDNIQNLESLVEEFPNVADYKLTLIKNYYNLGLEHNRAGQLQDAEADFAKAILLTKRLVKQYPKVSEYRSQLADVYSQLGTNLLDEEKFLAASEQLQLAFNVAKALTVELPGNLQYQEKLNGIRFSLASAKSAMGDYEAGEKVIEDYIAFQRNLVKRNPSNPMNQLNLATGHNNLALTYKETNRLPLAAEQFEKALKVVLKLTENYPHVQVKAIVANYLTSLTGVYADLGDTVKATESLDEATRIVVEYVSQHPKDRRLIKELVDISDLAAKLGFAEKRKDLLQDCEQTSRTSFGNDDALTLRICNQLGLAYQQLLEWDKADDCFRSIINTRSEIRLADPADQANLVTLAGAICNRANCLVSTGKVEQAIGMFTEAIEILETLSQEQKHVTAFLRNSYQGRANSRRKMGHQKLAIEDFQQALALPTTDLQKAENQLGLGLCFIALGDYDDAIEANRQAAEHEQVAPIANYNLACAYALNEQKDQALKALAHAVELGYGKAQSFEQDSDLDNLRGDIRYDQILRQLKNREKTEFN